MMSVEELGVGRTEETPGRRICLKKLGRRDSRVKRGGVIGCEYAPPSIGNQYMIYFQEGMVLRTSMVQDISESPRGLIIETANSVYMVEYFS
jgi:hypothetical protein